MELTFRPAQDQRGRHITQDHQGLLVQLIGVRDNKAVLTMDETRRHRIIFLGAGFSKPAGLPLGIELWSEIRYRANFLYGRAGKFHDDLKTYQAFRRDCDGIDVPVDQVDFEEFLGFLDVEFFLGLRGGDTWSDDGNETQVLIKMLIGEILTERTPPPERIPELYLDFARRLQPNDMILTFNYDVLLERALGRVGKPYRLFPNATPKSISTVARSIHPKKKSFCSRCTDPSTGSTEDDIWSESRDEFRMGFLHRPMIPFSEAPKSKQSHSSVVPVFKQIPFKKCIGCSTSRAFIASPCCLA